MDAKGFLGGGPESTRAPEQPVSLWWAKERVANFLEDSHTDGHGINCVNLKVGWLPIQGHSHNPRTIRIGSLFHQTA